MLIETKLKRNFCCLSKKTQAEKQSTLLALRKSMFACLKTKKKRKKNQIKHKFAYLKASALFYCCLVLAIVFLFCFKKIVLFLFAIVFLWQSSRCS